jgi:uncharacterized protein (TIGR03435 family)
MFGRGDTFAGSIRKATVCGAPMVDIMSRHISQEPTPGRKLLLGGVAALAIAIPLALGMTGASEGGTQGAGASNGRYPWFATATIKLNAAPAAEISASGNKFLAIEPAKDMIMFAYGEQRPLKPDQVLGGPGWITTEVFNIDAELPKSLSDQIKPPLRSVGPVPSYPADVRQTDAVKQIFRSLLVNRFKLRMRHETNVLPVYELVLTKNGPKIGKDETTTRSCRFTDIDPDLPSVFVQGKGRSLDVKFCDFNTFVGLLSASPELRSRVLVDKTGLHGRYSFKLHWTPEVPTGMNMPMSGGQSNDSAAPSESSGPSLFGALQEQLGLKLESTTGPVDCVIVDHIEEPSPN